MIAARHLPRQDGFTLIEMLIAMAIFAILSATAYYGLSTILTAQERINDNMDRLNAIQRSMLFLGRDLDQLVNRPIRSEYDAPLPALMAGVVVSSVEDTVLELTRTGYPNPLNVTRSRLQRVAYQLKDDNLYRVTWSSLDRAPDSRAHRTRMLEAVTDIKFRFLNGQTWVNQWPPLNSGTTTAGNAAGALPRAVEVSLELEDWGRITRLFPLVETP